MAKSNYWQERFLKEEQRRNKDARAYLNTIEKQYDIALRNIEKDINDWYMRLAKNNNNISLREAKMLLSKNELKEFKWTVEDYIQKGKENGISQEWAKQLENASARVHISKLEALKVQIQNEIEGLYGERLQGMENYLERVYGDTYYRTAFSVQQGLGIGWRLAALDTNRINQIIHKPWAIDGKNFSERLWEDKTKLINTLHTGLTQNIIRGFSPDNLIKQIAKEFGVKKSIAGRLVMTESAAYSSKAQEQCFKDLNVEKYEIIATLDTSTSAICREMDGKVFLMKDYLVGVTANPFHPNCRTVTAPYFEDDIDSMRAMRNKEGKIEYVPANMKYEEWYKKYVVKESVKNGIIKEKVNDIRLGLLEKDLGEEYSKNIKNILSKSPEKIQKIWNKYSEQFKFISINHTGTANYSTLKDGVSLNLKKIITDETFDFKVGRGEEIYKKAYGTFFHEFGHNISSLISREKGVKYFDFSDIFESKKYINKKGKGYMLSEMLKEETNDILNKIKKERKILKNEACLVMKEELRKMTVLESGDISDIFAGCTNNKVIGFMGHRADYWKRINVGVEAFVEMFDATVNNPSSLKRIKEYFPKSYDIFLEMLDEVEVE